MGLIITIPKNWNPNDKEAFNKWIDKIYKESIKSKY